MEQFAKLYDTTRGQVLALLQDGDNGPEIRVFFRPNVAYLGLCSVAVSGFRDDNDEADAAADKVFEKLAQRIMVWKVIDAH